MAGVFRHGHYLLGIEGLALLRGGAQRSGDPVEPRVEEIREIAVRLEELPYSARRDLPASDVQAGYSSWAQTYDQPGNDTIALEEPIVHSLLDDLPPGPVLDAACGTGRHAAYLAAGGHEVLGVDVSEAMLAHARRRLPAADLRVGDLTDLPLEDDSVTGAVCALALSHLAEIAPPVAELGRVLVPGGRLIISDPHPLASGLLGWRAVYTDEAGLRRMIPEHPHLHSEYIDAFRAAGLVVRLADRARPDTSPGTRARPGPAPRGVHASAHRAARGDRLGGREGRRQQRWQRLIEPPARPAPRRDAQPSVPVVSLRR